jgi:PhzF family phenazine biosynthesis protein
MRQRPFRQIDVFTSVPYLGNPVAVVLDGEGLSDAEMQRFARWTNLSETTFVTPPTPQAAAQGADYQVRIFTPGGELPFAGHPTLGTCHAWLEAGGQPQSPGRIVQQCQVGLIQIAQQYGRLAFAAPKLTRRAPEPGLLADILKALGLQTTQVRSAQLLYNGPEWLGILVDSTDTVLQVEPDHMALKTLGHKVGLVAVEYAQPAPLLIARKNREARAFAPSGPSGQAQSAEANMCTVEVRAFASPLGVNEDPVTGSLNASLAQWLISEGHAPPCYLATQGCCVGRDGHIHIEQDASGQVWVGGDAVTCISGIVAL